MTPEQFTYWLQGFIASNDGDAITKNQWKAIQEKLVTVFKKETVSSLTNVTGPCANPNGGNGNGGLGQNYRHLIN